MKRLLTYLSAIIIMMMVPIGAQAWDDIQMIADFSGSEQTYGASGVSGNDATIIVDASSLTHGISYNFKIKSSYNGGTYWGWNYTFDMTSNSKVTNIYASDNSGYFKIKHDSKYLKYKFTFNYTNQSDDDQWKWKITVEGITATLTIGGTDIAGTNSGSNYYFDIPAAKYTAGSPMSFTLKTETGGTATYYTGNFTGTASGDAFTYSTSTSSASMSYSVPSDATGLIRVSLLTGTNEVVFAYTPSGGGGTSTGYYLVGDLNAFGRPYNDVDWDGKSWGDYGAVNKVLKFKDNGDGTYSLRIPAAHPAENENEWDKPSKEKQDVSHEFVIAPESAFSG